MRLSPLAFICALLLLPGSLAAQEKPNRPNVIIVMTDDQGLGDFSYTGNPILKTPQLDAFAKQSVRLTDFHVCPMCSPTRGQLMTGLAALRNGATSVTAGRTFMRPNLPTLPQAFASAGYKTGIFGKWHLGDSYPHRPMDRGFQEAIYHLGWGQLHSTPEFDWPLFDGRYFHNGIEKRYKGHCTDVWFDSAMNWMRERNSKNEPFFCYLPTNAPHAPHIDIEKFIAPYEKPKQPAGFFGMIAHIDQRFGDLEKFLVEQKLRDNTIVIFMTDNGGTAGVPIFNAGLRGRKTQYYEGGHRVPCWIRWPNGKLGEARDITTPTQNTDLFPTLCDFCNVPKPQRAEADAAYAGTSLAGLLRGEAKSLPERTMVVQYGQIIKPFESCVIRGKWRLVAGKELYDVEADLAQKNDVAAANPKMVASLRSEYETWWKGLEKLVDEFVPISLGAKQQPIVEMTSGDWESIYADNTGFVREAVGGPTGGEWNVLIEQPGEYEFTLRRWPEQTNQALGAKYEPNAKSPAYPPKVKTMSFPTIARAHLQVGDAKAEVAADAQANSTTITLKLPAGKTKMKAWFADAEKKNLCGAFFVTVKLKNTEAKPDHEKPKPNVLFIVADDLRVELGCYGSVAKTSNLDALAKTGLRFDRAYCQQAVCNPSRSSFLTGLRPDTLGLHVNGTHFRELKPDVVTLPQWFKQNGYETRGIGKIFHNWHTKQKGDRGSWSADEFLHYANHGKDAPEVKGELPKNTAIDIGRMYGDVPLCEKRDVPDEAYFDGRVAAEAVRVMSEVKEKPFFLAVGFWKPHAPFNAPKKYWDMYDAKQLPQLDHRKPRNAVDLAFHDSREILGLPPKQITPNAEQMQEMRHGYYANISYMDAQIGKVLKALDDNKLRENTIIVFISDHGYHIGEHTLWGKTSNFENDARVPMIVSRPGMKATGQSTTSLVELVDLFPTFNELCALKAPNALEGKSFAPMLDDAKKTTKNAAFSQHPRPAYSDRTKTGLPDAMGYSVRTENLRYTEWRDWKTGKVLETELYNHVNDPHEMNNLAGNRAYPRGAEEALQALRKQFPIKK